MGGLMPLWGPDDSFLAAMEEIQRRHDEALARTHEQQLIEEGRREITVRPIDPRYQTQADAYQRLFWANQIIPSRVSTTALREEANRLDTMIRERTERLMNPVWVNEGANWHGRLWTSPTTGAPMSQRPRHRQDGAYPVSAPSTELEPYDWYTHVWMGQPRRLAHPMQLSLFELSPPQRPTRIRRVHAPSVPTQANHRTRNNGENPNVPRDGQLEAAAAGRAYGGRLRAAANRLRGTATPVPTVVTANGADYHIPERRMFARIRVTAEAIEASRSNPGPFTLFSDELAQAHADVARRTAEVDPTPLPVTNRDR